MRAKLDAPAFQFIVEPQHTWFEATSLNTKGQLRYPHIKDSFVRKAIEVDGQNLQQPFAV